MHRDGRQRPCFTFVAGVCALHTDSLFMVVVVELAEA